MFICMIHKHIYIDIKCLKPMVCLFDQFIYDTCKQRHWPHFMVQWVGVGVQHHTRQVNAWYRHQMDTFFPRYCHFVRGSRRSPVNSPHKGQWRGALLIFVICAWINGWVNNRGTGDLRRHRAHYNFIVMASLWRTALPRDTHLAGVSTVNTSKCAKADSAVIRLDNGYTSLLHNIPLTDIYSIKQ